MVRKATARDVAALAGVSRSAVSMVLNGRGDGNIAADKQAAIRAAAAELDYTPNAVALSLRNRRTRTIGVVTDAIATTAFGGRVLDGAAAVAAESGYVLVVMDSHFDERREAEAYRSLLDRRVDALLFAAMAFRAYESPALMQTIPSVLANAFDTRDTVAGFVPAEVAGGRTATRALLDAGHTDILMLTGRAHIDGIPELVAVGRREQGFREAMAAAGLPAREPLTSGWDIVDGYRAASHVLSGPDRPTGVLAANDRCAVGVVLAAAHLGLRVPEDLSVVGYDDDENVAPTMVPAFTTVELPHRAMGEHAARRLFDLLAGVETDGAGVWAIPCPLVERDSVAPPYRRG